MSFTFMCNFYMFPKAATTCKLFTTLGAFKFDVCVTSLSAAIVASILSTANSQKGFFGSRGIPDRQKRKASFQRDQRHL